MCEIQQIFKTLASVTSAFVHVRVDAHMFWGKKENIKEECDDDMDWHKSKNLSNLRYFT